MVDEGAREKVTCNWNTRGKKKKELEFEMKRNRIGNNIKIYILNDIIYVNLIKKSSLNIICSKRKEKKGKKKKILINFF